jgi:DUF438 domain-containing protein
MAVETLTEDEWLVVAQESDEIGFCLYQPEISWQPERIPVSAPPTDSLPGAVSFETGVLTPQEITSEKRLLSDIGN